MSSIKKFVNDKPLWDSWLEQESTMEGMYRTQGEIAALRKLAYLRDEVNGPSK
jgi:hypothetical protein